MAVVALMFALTLQLLQAEALSQQPEDDERVPIRSPGQVAAGAAMTLGGQTSAALCVIGLYDLQLSPWIGPMCILLFQAVTIAGMPLILVGGARDLPEWRKRRSAAAWGVGTVLATLGAGAAGSGAHFAYIAAEHGQHRDMALGLTIGGGAGVILGTSLAVWGMRPARGRYQGNVALTGSLGGMLLRGSF